MLPGLFRVVNRNVGRGFADLALFEFGHVFRLGPDGSAGGSDSGARGAAVAPMLAVGHGPTKDEEASLDAALPDQPRLVGCVLTGKIEAAGWWGDGRQATFSDAIEAARRAGDFRVPYAVRAGQREPWHPGRCAEFVIENAAGSAKGRCRPWCLATRANCIRGWAPRSSWRRGPARWNLTCRRSSALRRPCLRGRRRSSLAIR